MFDPFLQELAEGQPERYSHAEAWRDMRQVFLSTPEGRRVLHHIFQLAGMYRTSVRGKNFDPNEVLFHEGERFIGLTLLRTMTMEPKDQPKQTAKVPQMENANGG